MKKYFRYLLISAIIAFAASCGGSDDDDGGNGGGNGGDPNPPSTDITLQKKEMRGAWIATVWSLDWPQSDYNATSQKKKYTDLLDKLADSGVNAVFVQISQMAMHSIILLMNLGVSGLLMCREKIPDMMYWISCWKRRITVIWNSMHG